MNITPIPLCIDNRVYKVTPTFPLICEIEEELGGVSGLLESFKHNTWKVSELVTLTHILLYNAGRLIDFNALGATMLAGGIDSYVPWAIRFLQHALKQTQRSAA